MFTPYLRTFSYIHSQPLQFAKGAVMLRPDIRVSVSIFAILKCVHKPLVMVKLKPPGIRQAQTSHKPTTKPLNRWITPFFESWMPFWYFNFAGDMGASGMLIVYWWALQSVEWYGWAGTLFEKGNIGLRHGFGLKIRYPQIPWAIDSILSLYRL